MPDREDLDLIQSSCFYIRKRESDDDHVEVDGNKYYYFELLDESKKVIDFYDYIKIIAHVQIDFEDDMFRIYPALTPKYHYECVFYNRHNHTITTPEDEVDVANSWEKALHPSKDKGINLCEE